jgi:hypothetical protein
MKATYYTLENGRLVRAKRVIKIGNRWVANPKAAQCAQIGAYPKDEATITPPTCDEGYHAVPDGYALTDGKWAKKWRIEPLPPPPPVRYSKLKLIVAAKAAGKWSTVKAAIQTLGLEDEWQACQFISSDYPAFQAALAAVIAKGLATEEEVKAFLKEAEEE